VRIEIEGDKAKLISVNPSDLGAQPLTLRVKEIKWDYLELKISGNNPLMKPDDRRLGYYIVNFAKTSPMGLYLGLPVPGSDPNNLQFTYVDYKEILPNKSYGQLIFPEIVVYQVWCGEPGSYIGVGGLYPQLQTV
jgi:hypothetical protein